MYAFIIGLLIFFLTTNKPVMNTASQKARLRMGPDSVSARPCAARTPRQHTEERP